MCSEQLNFCFQQLHIDIARNATDDFNPFHDPHRWNNVRDNPYGGPIVLGFQLAALADYLIDLQRHADGCKPPPLRFSNYEFRFARALRPGRDFFVDVRRTLEMAGTMTASNRVMLRESTGEAILLGSRSDALIPSLPIQLDAKDPDLCGRTADRNYLPGTRIFLKRKYLNTSNGKNFLLGSLIDPFSYFDELAERVRFPPVFTASFVSCALLERARAEGYDFERDPQVYVSLRWTVDRNVQQALRSNDCIDILVETPTAGTSGNGLRQAGTVQQCWDCAAFVAGRGSLFRAQVQTVALRAIVGS